VAARAGYRCEYCHAPEAVFNFPFEVEHIIPLVHGGDNHLENLALACRACNLYKGDFETGADDQNGEGTVLFNPRQDVWAMHFDVDPSSGEMAGLTPVGRATVSRLQLNRPRHVDARRRSVQLELFP
jgi:hypothetical protein